MSLTLRGIKGSALTHGELDNNFIWLSSRDIVAAVIDSNSNLILTKEDSSYYSVPLSGFGGTSISGLTFSGNVLTITQSDGTSVSVNISSVDIRVTDLVYSANTLILYQSDGSSETVLIPQFSGGTINGPTNFTNGLSANTFNTTSLTLNGVTITGFTSYSFTGNTSGNCITDLFVKNLNSCSPLRIQNVSSGNVLIGENGGVNVGIGTSNPTAKLTISANTPVYGDILNISNSQYPGIGTKIDGLGNLTVEGPSSTGYSELTIKNSAGFQSGLVVDSNNIGSSIALKRSNQNRYNIVTNNVDLVDETLYVPFRTFLDSSHRILSRTGNTEVMYLDATVNNSKVGIGTTTPSSKLHVLGSDSSTGFGLKVQNSGGTNTLQVRNDGLVEFGDVSQPSNTWLQYTGGTLKLNYNTTSNFYWNGSDLKLTGLNGNGNSKLEFTSINAKQQTLIRSYNNERLSFATNAGSANMQLSSSGNLYIGNDTVLGVDASARLEVRGSGTTSSGYGLKVQNSSGTDNLVVRDDGNVGVQTSSPSSNFQVNQSSVGIGLISATGVTGYVAGYTASTWTWVTGVGTQFTNTLKEGDIIQSSGITLTIVQIYNNASIYCQYNPLAVFGTYIGESNQPYTLTTGQRLNVLGNGNIGIGTTSPTAILDIRHSNSDTNTDLQVKTNNIELGELTPVRLVTNNRGGAGLYLGVENGNSNDSGGIVLNGTNPSINLNGNQYSYYTGILLKSGAYGLGSGKGETYFTNYGGFGIETYYGFGIKTSGDANRNNSKYALNIDGNQYVGIGTSQGGGVSSYGRLTVQGITTDTNTFKVSRPTTGLGTVSASQGVGLYSAYTRFDGIGTTFTRCLNVGESIISSGFTLAVQQIVSDTVLYTTLNTGATFTNQSYTLQGLTSINTTNLGRVGIRTDTPNANLHVHPIGTTYEAANLLIPQDLFVVGQSSGSYLIKASIPSYNSSSLSFATYGGNITFDLGSNAQNKFNVKHSVYNNEFNVGGDGIYSKLYHGGFGSSDGIIDESYFGGSIIASRKTTKTIISNNTGGNLPDTYEGLRIYKGSWVNTSGTTYYPLIALDGNVGIGTSTPSETLEVNGKTKTTNFQMTSGATTAGYVLTDSDGSGNAQWRPVSGITGVGNVFKYTTNLTFTDNETKTVTHNLNTKFTHCSVWDYSTDELVTAQVLRNGVNAVNITIATAGNYDILITG